MDFISGFKAEVKHFLKKKEANLEKLTGKYRKKLSRSDRKGLKASNKALDTQLYQKVDSFIVEHRFAAAKRLSGKESSQSIVTKGKVANLRATLIRITRAKVVKDTSTDSLTPLLQKSTVS